MRECLAGLDPDLSGRTIVGMFTGTADEAKLTARRVEELGARYLDAGLQASPEMVETGTAPILYGGAREAFARHRATLELLGPPRLVGERPEAAAVWTAAGHVPAGSG
ncbi:hypothetical protein Asi02nite_40120 [Asanoa siamensis]|uniref:6-phosphogluconate dehydrogenase NADP-binding domain-containing protein n=1 Tax=Asanoa siamensis TaxID=926357 RepID=A0ABQ4CT87_9ACTN|nr:hypothetical protein Asi02nite_40120 [Asanoa siamensis]